MKRKEVIMYLDDEKGLKLWAKEVLADEAMERALETQAELDADHLRDMGEDS